MSDVWVFPLGLLLALLVFVVLFASLGVLT